MWTLRDLWHLIDPQAGEEWRKRQAEEISRKTMPYPQSLRDLLEQKNDLINYSKAWDNPISKRYMEASPLQNYQQGAEDGYDRHMGKLRDNLFGLKGTL